MEKTMKSMKLLRCWGLNMGYNRDPFLHPYQQPASLLSILASSGSGILNSQDNQPNLVVI